MKRLFAVLFAAILTLNIFAEDDEFATPGKNDKKVVNQNVPGEINNWMLNIGTSFVGLNHQVDVGTNTTIGLPFDQTSLAAGYQISSQIWLMGKFHLLMTFDDDDASGYFLIGPGIRADFIRTDKITFFGEFFLSLGNEEKTFLLSPEIDLGIDYNVKNYLAIGIFTDFAYVLRADDDDSNSHTISFVLGPRLSVFF